MTKLATIRTASGTRAVRFESTSHGEPVPVHVDLGFPSLKEYLAGGTPDAEAGTTYPVEGADFAPVVPEPGKIFCVGLNYADHIAETGLDKPEYPILFAKYAETLIGAYDDIQGPNESTFIDWEVELTIVIGKTVRRATEAEAAEAIAGFTVMNDISERDWQNRTREWLQGKIWEATTPVGPYMVTPEDLPGGVRPALTVSLTVDGVEKQRDTTSTLVFDPVALVQYISTIITLKPGDLIATGTCGGIGAARQPRERLNGGETVIASVEGVGETVNKVVRA